MEAAFAEVGLLGDAGKRLRIGPEAAMSCRYQSSRTKLFI